MDFYYVLLIFSLNMYVWVASLKNKQDLKITNAFQKFSNEFGCKPSQIWVDEGTEVYNRLMKSWFQDNGTEISSTQN